jgi:hypothetical protein
VVRTFEDSIFVARAPLDKQRSYDNLKRLCEYHPWPSFFSIFLNFEKGILNCSCFDASPKLRCDSDAVLTLFLPTPSREKKNVFKVNIPPCDCNSTFYELIVAIFCHSVLFVCFLEPDSVKHKRMDHTTEMKPDHSHRSKSKVKTLFKIITERTI